MPPSDWELSRRFTELANPGKHRDQVEMAREHLKVEEEKTLGLERELMVVTEQVAEVRDAQSVRIGGRHG